MGIHRFFSFLKKRFKELVQDELRIPPGSYVEGLYVDLNSPIHSISQRFFKYALDRDDTEADKALKEELRKMSSEDRKKIFFKCIGIFLRHAYLHAKPLKVFMIAVDGVAPKAKMVQQRTRRFKGATIAGLFDPGMISAGTPFMDELDTYLTGEWLQEMIDGAVFPASSRSSIPAIANLARVNTRSSIRCRRTSMLLNEIELKSPSTQVASILIKWFLVLIRI